MRHALRCVIILTLLSLLGVSALSATWFYLPDGQTPPEATTQSKTVLSFAGYYSDLPGASTLLKNGGTVEELQVIGEMVNDLADAEARVNQALDDRNDGYFGFGFAGRDYVGSTDNSTVTITNADGTATTTTQGALLQEQYGIKDCYFIVDESDVDNGKLYIYTTPADLDALKAQYVATEETTAPTVTPVFKATYTVTETTDADGNVTSRTISLDGIVYGNAPFCYYIEQVFLGGLFSTNTPNKIPSFDHTSFTEITENTP